MGLFKRALEDAKPEIEAMKQSAAAQMRRNTTASYGASIDETLDGDLHPEVKKILLGSLVEDRDSELERIRKRHE